MPSSVFLRLAGSSGHPVAPKMPLRGYALIAETFVADLASARIASAAFSAIM